MKRILLLGLIGLVVACSGSRGERIKSVCITNDECGADALCDNGTCVRRESSSVEARAAVEGAPPDVHVDHQVVGDETCQARAGELVCELAPGSKVVLVAPEVDGYRFIGWSGAPACTGSERVLELDSVLVNTACTARYVRRLRVTGVIANEEQTFVLTSSSSPFAACEQNSCVVDQGSAVRLLAPERDGYRLVSFEGAGCSDAQGYEVHAEPTDADVVCIATYVESLTVRGVLQGVAADVVASVAASSSAAQAHCDGALCAVDPAQSVVLRAPEIVGYRFRGWFGAEQCTGSEPELTIEAVRANLVCNADYVRRFTVRAVSEGAEATLSASADDGFPVCSGAQCEVDQGSAVTLIASAVPGYRLRDWHGEGCTGASGSSAVARDVASDVACTATFVEGVAVSGTVVNADAAVTATSSSPGASCAEGRCTIDVGGSVTLSAPTLAERTFRGWSGGEGCTGSAPSITLANVTESKDCRATFAPRYRVQGRPTPNQGGSVAASSSAGNARCSDASCDVDDGSAVTLTARAATNFRFTGWSGGGACAGNTAELTLRDLHASISCNANFVARIQVSGAAEPANAATIAASSASSAAACQGASCTVDSGADVMLRATPIEGYRFTRWSGCGNPENPQLASNPLLVAAPTRSERCTANFERIVYTVNAIAGTGGSVRGTVGDVACSNASCSVAHGDSVSFEATPATGYTFSGWTGCASSDEPELTLEDVSEGHTCRASFALIQLTVSAFASSGGDVSATSGGSSCPNARCTINYGADVTVTASARTGAEFTGWSGCSDSTERSITLNDVMASQQCTASFRALQYTVRGTLTPANSGNTSCPNGCSVQHGGSITLTANANTAQGYTFAGWTDCAPATQNPLTLNNVTGDRVCTARFERIAITASVTAGSGGAIMASSTSAGASCTGSATNASCALRWGDGVRFTAQPTNNTYRFVNWTGGGRCSGTSPTLELSALTGNVACTANFERSPLTASVTAGTGGSIAASSPSAGASCTGNASSASCSLRAGDSVRFSAQPLNTSYRFVNWSGSARCSGASPTLELTSLTGNVACTANFERSPLTASVAAGPGGSITASSSSAGASCSGNGANASCSLRSGDSVRFTAQPTNNTYTFVNWSGSTRCTGNSPTLELTGLTANVACTANFQLAAWNVTFTTQSSVPATVSLDASGASCANGRCTRSVQASDRVTTTLTFLTPILTSGNRGVVPALLRWDGCTPSSTELRVAAPAPGGNSFEVTYTSTFSGFRDSATCTARIGGGSFVVASTRQSFASVSSSQGWCAAYPASTAGAYAQICMMPPGASLRVYASEANYGWLCVLQNVETGDMNDDAKPDSGAEIRIDAGANELWLCSAELG